MKMLTAEEVAHAVPRLADDVQRFDDASDSLRLRGPDLRRGPASRFFAWLFRLPPRVEVELDDIGRFVVDRCDGRNDLDTMAGELADRFKLTRREAEASLTVFMQSLLRRRLVVLDGLVGSNA